MGLDEFASQISHAYSTYGAITGSRLAASKVTERVLAQMGSRFNYGFRPLDYDWDVMIILDACRFDLFREFAPEHSVYERFNSVSSKFSCASTSREWFKKGFVSAPNNDVSNVHYVTQNPFLPKADIDRFHDVERLWDVEGEDPSGRLPPSTVTDVALDAYDSTEADQFVVHYLPPHAPFLHCEGKYNLGEKSWGGESHDVWFGLQVGEFDEGEVWSDYGRNLLTVLDEVQRLTKYISGDVIVTADHANGMGELGQYGHPGYVPLPGIKRVPWAKMTGEGQDYDAGDRKVVELEHEDGDQVQKRLESLGYV